MSSKLSIYELTKQIDLGNLQFYSLLDQDQKKEFAPWTAMIWASSVDDPAMTDYYLDIINQCVNKNLSSLTGHPDLVWKLLTVVGLGHVYRRKWPGSPQGKKVSKTQKFLMSVYPTYSLDDIQLLESLNTPQDIKALAIEHGYSDQEIKKLLG